MKLALDVALPPAVVTEILPVFAPVGTVSITVPAERTVNGALTPPIRADVTPPRLVPFTVIAVPTLPELGEKLLMRGATALAETEKLELLVALPAAVVTVIRPLVAPAGTPVTRVVPEITVKGALTPLNFTLVAPVKLAPVMVTAVPTPP